MSDLLECLMVDDDVELASKLGNKKPGQITSIEIGIDLYGKSDKYRFLHIAAYLNAFDCFSFLVLQKGCSIFVKDQHSMTPIHYALQGGSEEVITFIFWLIDNNPDYQEEFKNLLESNYHANTNSLLLESVRENTTVGLEGLFAHGFDMKRVSQSVKVQCQERCISRRNIQGLSILLQHDTPTGMRNDSDTPPIINAIINGNAKAVEILADWGAPLDKCYKDRNNNNNSPLLYACETPRKSPEIIQTILDKTLNLDSKDLLLAGPSIKHACNSKNLECATYIVQRGIDCNIRDTNHRTGAYYLAMWENDPKGAGEILNLMVNSNFMLNPNCKEEQLPICEVLALSAMYGINPYLIEVFLQHGTPIPKAALEKLRTRAKSKPELRVLLEKYGYGLQ